MEEGLSKKGRCVVIERKIHWKGVSVAERYRQLSSNQFSEGSIPSRHRGGDRAREKYKKKRPGKLIGTRDKKEKKDKREVGPPKDEREHGGGEGGTEETLGSEGE